jgi:hypothetical protein
MERSSAGREAQPLAYAGRRTRATRLDVSAAALEIRENGDVGSFEASDG